MKASPTEEYFCAQVSAQKPGANLGHPVFNPHVKRRTAKDRFRAMDEMIDSVEAQQQ